MRYAPVMSETQEAAFNPFDKSARLSFNRSLLSKAVLDLLAENPSGMTGDAIAKSVRARRSLVYGLFKEMWGEGLIVAEPHPSHPFGVVWKKAS